MAVESVAIQKVVHRPLSLSQLRWTGSEFLFLTRLTGRLRTMLELEEHGSEGLCQ